MSYWEGLELVGMGHEVVTAGDGRAYVAQFNPSLPYAYRSWPAFLRVDQWAAPPGWCGLSEWYEEPRTGNRMFGDIALASSGDGGVVFFWSQQIDRYGLFARRFAPPGRRAALRPDPAREITRLGLRFAKGVGVVANIGLDLTPERLDLFDVGGRRVASLPLGEWSSTTELALPGTASLTSGLYVARLMAGGVAAVARVAVVH